MEKINIKRDGQRSLSFTGVCLGSGTTSTSSNSTRWTTVSIYRTKSGRWVAKVAYCTQWEKETGSRKAASFDTPKELIEWLSDDNGGSLGVASQEACEEAATNNPDFAAAYVEEID